MGYRTLQVSFISEFWIFNNAIEGHKKDSATPRNCDGSVYDNVMDRLMTIDIQTDRLRRGRLKGRMKGQEKIKNGWMQAYVEPNCDPVAVCPLSPHGTRHK